MIKIGLIDLQGSYRDSMRLAFHFYEGLRLAFDSASKLDLTRTVARQLDLMLLNVAQEENGGAPAIKHIVSRNKKLQVIALANQKGEFNYQDLYNLGYHGCFCKMTNLHDLIRLIKQLQDPEQSKKSKPGKENEVEYNGEFFSIREIDIIKYTCMELDNHQIGEKLYLSKRTVEGYKSSIMKKLKSKHPASIIKMGLDLNLIRFR